MVWENSHIKGHFHASSCDIPDWSICHDCMVEHCVSTNCMGCEYGIYPGCRFLELKKHYSGNCGKGFLITNERNAIYDELCRVLTDYESNGSEESASADDLYTLLVKIQNRWEDVITAQDN